MLPPLPKQYNRKEAKITPLVFDWFLEHYPDDVLLEIKIKGNKPLPHQDLALDKVHAGKFKYKFPDMGKATPGDGIVLKKAKAFVITCQGMECEAVGRHGEKFSIHL